MLRLVKHPLYLATFWSFHAYAEASSVQDLLPREVFEPSEKDLAEARAFLQDITPHMRTQDIPTPETPTALSSPSAESDSSKGLLQERLQRGPICREQDKDGNCRESSTFVQGSFVQNSDLRISILVSFSLSTASLQALYEEAQVYGARLVVRGLFKDSFAETRQKIQDLEIVVEVDPEIFERLGVKAVPIFVVQKGEQVETVRGHTTLRYALETLTPTFPGLKEKLRSCERPL